MLLKVKKLTKSASLPVYATTGAACFDLISDSLITCNVSNSGLHTVTFGTGLSFEIPKDHVMLVFGRSGHAFNSDISLSNCVGVIDSDYRGEVKVKLRSDSTRGYFDLSNVSKGDRIAQAMVIPCEQVQFEVVDELSETQRGAGGFGSTGK